MSVKNIKKKKKQKRLVMKVFCLLYLIPLPLKLIYIYIYIYIYYLYLGPFFVGAALEKGKKQIKSGKRKQDNCSALTLEKNVRGQYS